MKEHLIRNLLDDYPITYREMNSGKRSYFDVNDGWYDLIDRMSLALEILAIKKQAEGQPITYLPYFLILKQKFGMLNAYLYDGCDETASVISKAIAKSKTTCEVCSSAGQIVPINNWLKCLCPDCIIKETKVVVADQ